MHNARIIILAGFLSLIAQARGEPPAGYRLFSFDDGLGIASGRDQRLFLYFGRYGCTWCDLTNEEAFSDPQVHRVYSEIRLGRDDRCYAPAVAALPNGQFAAAWVENESIDGSSRVRYQSADPAPTASPDSEAPHHGLARAF